jgi:hypothetical protein
MKIQSFAHIAAAAQTLASLPAAVARSTSCTSVTEVFRSPAGNRYAVSSCNSAALTNALAAFQGKCNATIASYDYGAPYWHITRSYAGTVNLGVEHHGVKDPTFQACLDSAAHVVNKTVGNQAKIAGIVIGSIIGVALVCVGAYYAAKQCRG